ncbi:MAG: DUF599 domain-containing protein [Alphaproteobacteria bacterium]|jgi:uncharacterized membrane protein|nr:DUF599 domain-containing protein [Alphaproteobacteria bacterium]MBT7941952.1 DUF599 domain-containing protein [Alphaproteobacteria bacterium]
MTNTLSGSLPVVPLADILAFAWFMVMWVGYTVIADRQGSNMRPASRVMHDFRVRWMERMLERDNRMADVNIVAAHMRIAMLFTTISILILAGVMTIMGNLGKAREVVSELSFAVGSSQELWEIKTFVLMFIFVYAFFKYAWCLRQFNFTLIFIGAAPLPEEVNARERKDYPNRGARLMDRSITTFNRGLRAYYFGLALLAWFIGPLYLVISAVWVVAVLYRRDYRSVILQTLSEQDADANMPVSG